MRFSTAELDSSINLFYSHKSPVKNCVLPIPKLQSSFVFAEQVTIRSVPGTPVFLQPLLQLGIQSLLQLRIPTLLENLYEDQFIRPGKMEVCAFADYFLGFVLGYDLVSVERVSSEGRRGE
jgi:hypothetical protein